MRSRLVLVLWSVAVATLTLASPAAAHTDLLQASPGPGQMAGGVIDFIDFAFLEPVSEAVVDVEFDGETVPGTTVQAEGQIIRFEFDEPLSSAGRYDVSYSILSFDLDHTEASFFFTYDPDAPQAIRIGTVDLPGGRNWVLIIVTAVLIVTIVGLAFQLLSRVEARRSRKAASDDSVHGG